MLQRYYRCLIAGNGILVMVENNRFRFPFGKSETEISLRQDVGGRVEEGMSMELKSWSRLMALTMRRRLRWSTRCENVRVRLMLRCLGHFHCPGMLLIWGRVHRRRVASPPSAAAPGP